MTKLIIIACILIILFIYFMYKAGNYKADNVQGTRPAINILPQDLDDVMAFLTDLCHLKYNCTCCLAPSQEAHSPAINVELTIQGVSLHLIQDIQNQWDLLLNTERQQIYADPRKIAEQAAYYKDFSRKLNERIVRYLFDDFVPKNWLFEELWKKDSFKQTVGSDDQMEICSVLLSLSQSELGYKRAFLQKAAEKSSLLFHDIKVNSSFESLVIQFNNK